MTKKLPSGFTYVHIQDKSRKRSFIKCTLQIKTSRGTYPCGFIKRTDTLSKELPLNEQLKHKCFNCTLDRYNWASTTQQEIAENGNKISDILTKALAALTGKQCLSIRTSTSPYMSDLLRTAIRLGQQFPDIDPDDLLPSMNRKSFTINLIIKGKELYNQIFVIYKEYKFAALAVDAGKIGSINYFDIMICNALIDAKPLIFKAYQHFKGDSAAYTDRMKDAITTLKEDGVIVTGIVGDNLRVQTTSIANVRKDYPSLFHINCGAHLLHNGVGDGFKADSELEHMLDSLEVFCSFMNSKPVLACFKLSTPTRCLTRWTNVFDIAFHVAKHYDAYRAFFENKDTYSLSSFKEVQRVKIAKEVMLKIVPIFTIVLFPLAILSQKLENDRSTIGNTYGFELSALFLLDELAIRFQEIRKYIKIISNSVRERFRDRESCLLEHLAFLLTPKGRNVAIYAKSINRQIIDCREKLRDLYPIEIFDQDDQLLTEMYEKYSSNENLEQCFDQIIESFKTKRTKRHQARNASSDEYSDYSYEYEDKTDPISGLKPAFDLENEEEEDSTDTPYDDGTSESEDMFDADIARLINETMSNDQTKSDTENEVHVEDSLDAAVEHEMSNAPLSGLLFMEEASPYTFQDLTQTIYEYALYSGLDGVKAAASFAQWLQYPTPFPEGTIANIMDNNILGTWKYFECIEDFRDLSLLAQRLLVIPSSEASCERMFWKQRKILTNEFSRTGKKLAFSRLVFMTQID